MEKDEQAMSQQSTAGYSELAKVKSADSTNNFVGKRDLDDEFD